MVAGKIVYEVEAVIIKTAALKFNTKFAVELPYSPAIAADPTHSWSPGTKDITSPKNSVLSLLCLWTYIHHCSHSKKWILHWSGRHHTT